MPHRPDKELFGSNERMLEKSPKYLKNLIPRCPETRHLRCCCSGTVRVPPITQAIYNRNKCCLSKFIF